MRPVTALQSCPSDPQLLAGLRRGTPPALIATRNLSSPFFPLQAIPCVPDSDVFGYDVPLPRKELRVTCGGPRGEGTATQVDEKECLERLTRGEESVWRLTRRSVRDDGDMELADMQREGTAVAQATTQPNDPLSQPRRGGEPRATSLPSVNTTLFFLFSREASCQSSCHPFSIFVFPSSTASFP
ncbi:hypothetical protein BV22DRAFT_122667 [Leucogyrophana mollusca]|uniref:Uncharacterized protein n=1 Tax=Leucogyrophana mollusca TaxID=85980 RepID=A0ACB8BVL6_9AGAM|nr:hypothetical protein BV22DRAFT_122667 [Leucogyrophana mollusca]